MRAGPKELAKILGVDPRSVTNYVNAGMPRAAHGEYDVPACVRWYVERERDTVRLAARKRAAQSDVDLAVARLRKLTAEATEAEVRVATMLGAVVPLETVSETTGRLADRLLAVLLNVPANYGLRLEELGIPAAKAEAVLEAIAVELTTALRDAVDEDEAEEQGEVDDGHRETNA